MFVNYKLYKTRHSWNTILAPSSKCGEFVANKKILLDIDGLDNISDSSNALYNNVITYVKWDAVYYSMRNVLYYDITIKLSAKISYLI